MYNPYSKYLTTKKKLLNFHPWVIIKFNIGAQLKYKYYEETWLFVDFGTRNLLRKQFQISKSCHIDTCGAKGSGDSSPFDIKPKAHAEEEEVPENE